MSQALPSIASLTSSLSPAEQSPIRLAQHPDSREARDSGNWSISQSKRKCQRTKPLVLTRRPCPFQHAVFALPPSLTRLQILQACPIPWVCNCRTSSMTTMRLRVIRYQTLRRRHDTPLACRPGSRCVAFAWWSGSYLIRRSQILYPR